MIFRKFNRLRKMISSPWEVALFFPTFPGKRDYAHGLPSLGLLAPFPSRYFCSASFICTSTCCWLLCSHSRLHPPAAVGYMLSFDHFPGFFLIDFQIDDNRRMENRHFLRLTAIHQLKTNQYPQQECKACGFSDLKWVVTVGDDDSETIVLLFPSSSSSPLLFYSFTALTAGSPPALLLL